MRRNDGEKEGKSGAGEAPPRAREEIPEELLEEVPRLANGAGV